MGSTLGVKYDLTCALHNQIFEHLPENDCIRALEYLEKT